MNLKEAWYPISPESDFSIYNIPFGIFSNQSGIKKLGVAIGDAVVDLGIAYDLGIFKGLAIERSIWQQEYLNPFINLGKEITKAVRTRIQEELCNPSSPLKENEAVFYPIHSIQNHLPIQIGDYTDFYSSIEHATNLGKLFRDPDNALLPNWLHIPVGYHGRSSSIVVTGTDIYRPNGQLKPMDAPPIYGPTERLDFELEMAFIIGKDSQLGSPISTAMAEEHIFGMALFNDWSARDIQKWEYVPLGPFLGKNFASTLSPWIVTMEALEFARVKGPDKVKPILPYLESSGHLNYDIHLEVGILPEKGAETILSRSNFKYMYWNMTQQLAHHTVNGCNVKVGDLMASGTISGPDEGSYGSLIELSAGGKREIPLGNGDHRIFINDYDTVTLRGYAKGENFKVGFGEARGLVLPAIT